MSSTKQEFIKKAQEGKLTFDDISALALFDTTLHKCLENVPGTYIEKIFSAIYLLCLEKSELEQKLKNREAMRTPPDFICRRG